MVPASCGVPGPPGTIAPVAKGHSAPEPRAPVASFVIVNTAGAGMTPAIASAVREAAICHGLPPDAADELREACETLVRRVAAGLEDTESGGFEVTISRLPGRVLVQIDDPGVPYELADDATGDPQAAIAAPSELLGFIRERVDHIEYSYRGRAGNRVELTKRVTRRRPKGDDPATSHAVDPDQPVEVRRMVEADAIPFVRKVYRSFGYTYAGEWGVPRRGCPALPGVGGPDRVGGGNRGR